jgi:hypothetical protein
VYPWDYKGSTRQTGVKPGSGYKSYIRITWRMAPWVKLNTEHYWTCGCADLFSVVKPMSPLWITL